MTGVPDSARPADASGTEEPGRRRLLVISSVRWGYLWQRHQALAVAAAADGWLVDFLEPHPRRAAQVARFALGALRGREPFSQPTPVPPGVRVLGTTAWLRPGSDRYDLVLCYVPDRWSIRRARATGAPVVYDAVLDWATVPASWYPPVGWRSAERALARTAAGVTTDSAGTQAILADRGIRSTVVHPAADDPFLQPRPAPDPGTAVYFGSVRDEVDSPVLVALAEAGIDVSVIGPVEREATRAALLAGGVRLRPPVDVETLAAEVGRHQFVLLPYRGARGTSLMPAKFWNCLASGRWVLTAGIDLPVSAPGLVSVDGQASAWIDAVHDREGRLTPAPTADVPTWAARWRTIAGTAGR
jgi:hypothetical protein